MASKSKSESLYTLSRGFLESALEFERYKQAMLGESHRSSALMASAIVEHTLLALIRTKFIPLDEEEDSNLFLRPGATLNTFSSRINIAYALGLIDHAHRSDLNVILDVRNVFSHAVKNIDFDHPLIEKECEKFKLVSSIPEEEKNDEARIRFIRVCHLLTIDLSGMTLRFQS